jgi:hypothetical protein
MGVTWCVECTTVLTCSTARCWVLPLHTPTGCIKLLQRGILRDVIRQVH